MKIDKRNGNVCFNEKSHTYFDYGEESSKYISVTTLIERYGQEFNKDFWSNYKALEKLIPKDNWKIEKKSLLNTKRFNKDLLSLYNISEDEFNKVKQDILDEWQKNNEEACVRGTKIHSELENSFYRKAKDITLQKYGIGGKFECKKDYTDLDLEYGTYPEYLIYRVSDDKVLKLAGQVDLIIKSGNEIIIVDYKTNRKIDLKSGFDTTSRSNIKMKYPLNNIQDSNFWHYTLQLSTYAWMLQKINPKFIIKDLILDHFDHDGKETLYHCEYLKNDVERMLKHYKKELLLQQKRNKRKPIEY